MQVDVKGFQLRDSQRMTFFGSINIIKLNVEMLKGLDLLISVCSALKVFLG